MWRASIGFAGGSGQEEEEEDVVEASSSSLAAVCASPTHPTSPSRLAGVLRRLSARWPTSQREGFRDCWGPAAPFSPAYHGAHLGQSAAGAVPEHGLSYFMKSMLLAVGRLLKSLFLRYELWVIAAVIAILTGFSAAFIEYSIRFLSDLRGGVCSGLFWHPRWLCCGIGGDVDFFSYAAITGLDQGCPVEQAPAPYNALSASPPAAAAAAASATASAAASGGSVAGSLPQQDDLIQGSVWYTWSQLLRVRGWGGATAPVLIFLVDYFAFIGVSVLLAVAAAFFCCRLSRYSSGSGIPEVKTTLQGFDIPHALGLLTLIVKCVGLALAVASGLSIGKEGPMIHIACCWAVILAYFAPTYRENPNKLRELVTAASATGVSVAFGAPIGGVLYSMEEIATRFPAPTLWSAFFCAVVGTLLIKYLDASGTGRLSLFRLDSLSLLGSWETLELIPFAFTGLLGGIIGTTLTRLNLSWARAKRGIPFIARHPVTEVALLALMTSSVSFPLPLLRASPTAVLQAMFNRCGGQTSGGGRAATTLAASVDSDPFFLCVAAADEGAAEAPGAAAAALATDYSVRAGTFISLSTAIVMRLALTVLTFGAAVPAGCFVPSLTIGALAGRIVGLVMIKMNDAFGFLNCHKCIHPGVYAIVGAAATLGGATRATISIVVIMFELTGGLSYVLPFMVAVLLAKWGGEALGPRSISEEYIAYKNYPHLNTPGISPASLASCVAAQASATKLVVISLDPQEVRHGGGPVSAPFVAANREVASTLPIVAWRHEASALSDRAEPFSTSREGPVPACRDPRGAGGSFARCTGDGIDGDGCGGSDEPDSARGEPACDDASSKLDHSGNDYHVAGSPAVDGGSESYAASAGLFVTGNTVGSLLAKCNKYFLFDNGFPVVTSRVEKRCLGFVTRRRLIGALMRHRGAAERTPVRFLALETPEIARAFTELGVSRFIDLSEAVDASCVYADPDRPLTELLNLFLNGEFRYCVLVSGGTCRGLVTRLRLVRFIQLLERRASEIAGTAFSEEGANPPVVTQAPSVPPAAVAWF